MTSRLRALSAPPAFAVTPRPALTRAAPALIACLAMARAALAEEPAGARAGASAGDAYARSGADGVTWTIGTSAVELTLRFQAGKLLVSSFKNLLVAPPREYVKAPFDPLASGPGSIDERFQVDTIWEKPLPAGAQLDLAGEGLKADVKKGDLLGFAVGPQGNYAGDQVEWVTRVTYAGGDSFASSDDPKVEQGPIWHHAIHAPGTGFLWFIDSVEWAENVKQHFRIPSEKSGYRAPGLTPHVGSTVLHPSPEHDAVRIWKAPRDGAVTLAGKASHVGGGDVDLKVLRIREKSGQLKKGEEPAWTLESGGVKAVEAGGRPAVRLDVVSRREPLRRSFHAIAHPGTPVLRTWAELENIGGEPVRCGARDIFTLALDAGGDAFTSYWMVGGNSQTDQGKLHAAEIVGPHRQELQANATLQYIPWMALQRKAPPGDGCFVDLDFLGAWRMTCTRDESGSIHLGAGSPQLPAIRIEPRRRWKLPTVFLGVFREDLDDMARRLYDWQYEYLWEFTHDDWYARMPFTVAWYGDSDNLQQQFAGHLGDLDLNWTDYLRTVGMELLWEDAGWSASRHWWEANMEGPDFAQTRRFLEKNDMRLIVWIPGHQSSGLLDSKVAAWGDFQRRTDGMGFDAALDATFRQDVEKFLGDHPRSSFHTCSGGSTYAHTFDVQRYADVNYDSDGPGSDYTNTYWSYRETPDRWFDNLNCFYPGKGVFYNKDTGRRFLTECPKWGLYIEKEDLESLRQVCDTYHRLLDAGLAGRWSYVAHPEVRGDDPRHYFQRLSKDRTRSIIILKHRAAGPVTVFPRGLLPNEDYLVDFDIKKWSESRKGADLMGKGISVEDQAPGELVYLNLPDRPRSGRDKTPPGAPGRALKRREMNIGHAGVGVYWSPGSDDRWISYYEVRRGGEILGKASTGTYFFDHSAGWDPAAKYSVRTVDGDGNASAWVEAGGFRDEPLAFSALGGHFPESGRDGWRAETTADGATYAAMRWVPPARPPSADLGGTTIQPGGAEGYWEGAGAARIGRGWQQASGEAACVRTWIAPAAGKARIVGRAMKEHYHGDQGGALRVKILHREKRIWPAEEWAVVKVGDIDGVTHDVTADLASGDAVRFVLDRGSAPEHDILAWMPTISYAGEAPVGTRASGCSAGDTARVAGAGDAVGGAQAGDVDRGAGGDVVRIACGAGAALKDPAGRVWSADRLFEGGSPIQAKDRILPGAGSLDDEALYRSGRAGGEFTYSIPVSPGLYCVRLKFAEPEPLHFFERPMDLSINGRRVLANFDVCQAARGPFRAHDRLFRYVVPDAEGKIQLRFRSGREPLRKRAEAVVQAVEITPEVKSLVRIDAGSDHAFIDWNGFVWSADAGGEGGGTMRAEKRVEHASPTLYDQELYRSARSGKSIRYEIPVLPGLYQVQLKFAELWLGEPGKRPMDITVNGRLMWKSWDPARQAGKAGMSADLRAADVAPDGDGHIIIVVSAAGENDAILQAIEIE